MLISIFKVEYDGSRTSTTLANHRFMPILWSLKLMIFILNNLLNKIRIEEITGTNHAKKLKLMSKPPACGRLGAARVAAAGHWASLVDQTLVRHWSLGL